jgi:hypothetical protein
MGYTRRSGSGGNPRTILGEETQGNSERCTAGGEFDEPISSGVWSDFDLVHCIDEKTRRIEPGLVPLVNGVPGRVAQLRGLGNAIVPQVAAVFIGSFLDVITTPEQH